MHAGIVRNLCGRSIVAPKRPVQNDGFVHKLYTYISVGPFAWRLPPELCVNHAFRLGHLLPVLTVPHEFISIHFQNLYCLYLQHLPPLFLHYTIKAPCMYYMSYTLPAQPAPEQRGRRASTEMGPTVRSTVRRQRSRWWPKLWVIDIPCHVLEN